MKYRTQPQTVVLSVILFLLTLIALSVFGSEVPLDKDFVNAIHQVETSGRTGPIMGNRGEIGPLQITHRYWRDARISGKFTDCSELTYSVKVITAYLNRFARQAVVEHNYETLARLHNGGPKWRFKPHTKIYWAKVKCQLTISQGSDTILYDQN